MSFNKTLYQNANRNNAMMSEYPSGNAPALNGAISSVSGSISDGQTITISGNGFGTNGPANYMFEDFSGGTTGQDATTDNTNFDSISSFWPPIFTDDSRSGGLAARMFRAKTIAPFDYAASINSVTLGAVTEVFKSFSVKIPSGKYFPGSSGGNSGTNTDYSTDSSWKMDWLLGPTSSRNDLITASHVGNGVFYSGGNDLGNLEVLGTNPDWFKFGEWNRMSQWVKAGDSPSVDVGNLYTQIANNVDAITEFNSTPVVFQNAEQGAPFEFNTYNINGWARPATGGSDAAGADIELLYDDIYVAWGSNSAARVELGNAATYESCSDLAICEAGDVNWADGTITATVHEGGLDLTQNTWLFVTLPDNTTRYSFQVVSV